MVSGAGGAGIDGQLNARQELRQQQEERTAAKAALPENVAARRRDQLLALFGGDAERAMSDAAARYRNGPANQRDVALSDAHALLPACVRAQVTRKAPELSEESDGEGPTPALLEWVNIAARSADDQVFPEVALRDFGLRIGNEGILARNPYALGLAIVLLTRSMENTTIARPFEDACRFAKARVSFGDRRGFRDQAFLFSKRFASVVLHNKLVGIGDPPAASSSPLKFDVNMPSSDNAAELLNATLHACKELGKANLGGPHIVHSTQNDALAILRRAIPDHVDIVRRSANVAAMVVGDPTSTNTHVVDTSAADRALVLVDSDLGQRGAEEAYRLLEPRIARMRAEKSVYPLVTATNAILTLAVDERGRVDPEMLAKGIDLASSVLELGPHWTIDGENQTLVDKFVAQAVAAEHNGTPALDWSHFVTSETYHIQPGFDLS
jgi:hypothetical protein